jgi:magnesium transporter
MGTGSLKDEAVARAKITGERKVLISCVAYKDGKKLTDIAVDEIRNYVNQPDILVWVALREPDADTLAQMQVQFGLHSLAVEDARNGHQRPKIEDYGDSLFAVLHVVEPGEAHELRTGEIAVFAGRNYLLTVRSHAERGFQDVRARCEREPDLLRHGSGFVLYALIDAVVDRYFPLLDSLEEDLERIEERLFSDGSPRTNIEALYKLKNRLTTVKHAVAPLLEAISNLSGARVPALCTGLREYFRDIYDHLLRLNQTIESIRDSVGTAISVNLSMVSLQENETMKRLAAYAALIAVPTLIAGVYGMNFEHMPELSWRYGYLAAVGSMVGIDLYLFIRLRKAKWL